VFNVTGSEIIILLLLALVILGPEKLPDAIRRFGRVYGELRKMSQGFQTELRDALDEPMRELRSTADMARRAIEEPANEVSGSAKGLGQAATDAFASATKFSAAPVAGGVARPLPTTDDVVYEPDDLHDPIEPGEDEIEDDHDWTDPGADADGENASA
jgi:sec-independent protein translocase protein TatB